MNKLYQGAVMSKFFQITALVLLLSPSLFAGKVKDLVIDADDAIVSELNRQGESVDEISGHRFVPSKNGIAVQALAHSFGLSWTCVVTFQEINSSYEVVSTVCQ